MRRLVAVLALLAGLVPTQARADHASGLRWAGHVAIVEDRTGLPYIRESLALAVARWNEAGADLDLTYRNGPADNICGYAGNLITVCRVPFTGVYAGYAGWANRAYDESGNLTGAFIELNAVGGFAPFPSGPPAIRNRIVAHEVGHTIGLDHSSDPDSVMTAEGFADLPSAHDYATIRAIYGPGGALAPPPPPTTTVPPTTTTTLPPPPPTSTPTTLPPPPPQPPPVTAPPTTRPLPPPAPPSPAGYCSQMRAARAQVDAALSRPGLERQRAEALRRLDLVLRGCPG